MNYGLFHWINDIAGRYPFLDKGMIFITNSVPYVVIVFMLFLWFTGNKEKRVEKQYTAIYIVFTCLLGLALNAILHSVYYHRRPFVTYHVHQLVPHATDSSFVSDHAVLVFSVACTLLLRKDSWKYPVLVWAIIVGISRIFVGVHYPADVIGGALLSLGASMIVVQFSKKLEPVVQIIFSMYKRLTKHIPILGKYSH
ncbi:undecaprenyl-diphosphatase [Lysinibacillus agricola]|uniref:Undecaprenyl-diphosphatase n=1 Tax=Lysinibacillus agricola TaxID=2590012 RepID=A0ABX7AXF5_9BACI|nr:MULTISPECIES: undecaprenyl-diphosphatase [Lysinibacillus]KOS60192.1 phosphoesterase [Lysinibacillus sp. FJAT-14222]QQP14481.1 undecaprenyl-diphosphatase [Lysinibacillus agricola]